MAHYYRILLALDAVVFLTVASPAAVDQNQEPADPITVLDNSLRERDPESLQESIEHFKTQSDAIPMIRDAVRTRGDARLRGQLLRVLGGLPGQLASDALLDLMTDSREDVRYGAMIALENRTIARPLLTDEWKTLVDAINEANGLRAGTAARVLAKCLGHPAEDRAKAILPRFVREINAPSESAAQSLGYLSPRVMRLNQFLLAFSDLRSAGVVSLLKEEAGKASAETRSWLIMARGMAGDNSVAAELREYVEDEHDLSNKAVALRAYSRCLGQQALPALEKYEKDATALASRDHHGTNPMPLQIVARDELARLRGSASSQPSASGAAP